MHHLPSAAQTFPDGGPMSKSTTTKQTQQNPTQPIQKPDKSGIEKAATGIAGFDDITFGGLPRNRPTLICGGPGTGKTLFGLEFLTHGITVHGEPGVFVSFDETAEDLANNVKSLGLDLPELIASKKLVLDSLRFDHEEYVETGEYDLGGLFIRVGSAIDSIGAKRIVLDSMEALFSGLTDHTRLRSEIRRLFGWLKDKGVTAIVTGESTESSGKTREGLDEFISDCVVYLDHRVIDTICTRRLRITKYRGSLHGTNEYPFLIDEDGICILPVTSLNLTYPASTEHVSTGIGSLDRMLDGKGYYRGSAVLVTGTAGSGKTSLGAHFINAAALRGERSLLWSFEESEAQIVRNMRSIGIDLEPSIKNGSLKILANRPHILGLEMHLAIIHREINSFQPKCICIDPISNFTSAGTLNDTKVMLTRLIDMTKSKGITNIMTYLIRGGLRGENTEIGISSLMDTWISMSNPEFNGEYNRLLSVMKSRGMPHSNQVREMLLTHRGIDLIEPYLGPSGAVTGAARKSIEASEKAFAVEREIKLLRKQKDLENSRDLTEARIKMLRSRLQTQEQSLELEISQAKSLEQVKVEDRTRMGATRSPAPDHKPQEQR